MLCQQHSNSISSKNKTKTKTKTDGAQKKTNAHETPTLYNEYDVNATLVPISGSGAVFDSDDVNATLMSQGLEIHLLFFVWAPRSRPSLSPLSPFADHPRAVNDPHATLVADDSNATLVGDGGPVLVNNISKVCLISQPPTLDR